MPTPYGLSTNLSPDIIRAIEEMRRLMNPTGTTRTSKPFGLAQYPEFTRDTSLTGLPFSKYDPTTRVSPLEGEAEPSPFIDPIEMLQNLLPAKLPLTVMGSLVPIVSGKMSTNVAKNISRGISSMGRESVNFLRRLIKSKELEQIPYKSSSESIGSYIGSKVEGGPLLEMSPGFVRRAAGEVISRHEFGHVFMEEMPENLTGPITELTRRLSSEGGPLNPLHKYFVNQLGFDKVEAINETISTVSELGVKNRYQLDKLGRLAKKVIGAKEIFRIIDETPGAKEALGEIAAAKRIARKLLPAKLPLAVGMVAIKPGAKVASSISKKIVDFFKKGQLINTIPNKALFINQYGAPITHDWGSDMVRKYIHDHGTGHEAVAGWMSEKLKIGMQDVLDVAKMSPYRMSNETINLRISSKVKDDVIPGAIKRIAEDMKDPSITKVNIDYGYLHRIEKPWPAIEFVGPGGPGTKRESFSGSPMDSIKWLRGLLTTPGMVAIKPGAKVESSISKKIVDLFNKKQLIDTIPEDATFINKFGSPVTTNWNYNLQAKYNESEHAGVIQWLSDTLRVPFKDVLKETKMATYMWQKNKKMGLSDDTIYINIPLGTKDDIIPGVINRIKSDAKDPSIRRIVMDVGEMIGGKEVNYIDFDPSTLRTFDGAPMDAIKWLRGLLPTTTTAKLPAAVSPAAIKPTVGATSEINERLMDLFTKRRLINTVPDDAMLVDRFGETLSFNPDKVNPRTIQGHSDIIDWMSSALKVPHNKVLDTVQMASYRMSYQVPKGSGSVEINIGIPYDVRKEVIPGVIKRIAKDAKDSLVRDVVIDVGRMDKSGKITYASDPMLNVFNGSPTDAIKWLREILAK